MTEYKNIKNNIHKAIRREDMSRPPMPKDLNARLMQRVEKEVNSKPQHKRKRISWPWVAAACVTVLLMVFLAPPEASQPPRSALATLGLSKKGELQIAHVAEDSTKHDKEPQPLIANAEHKAMKKKETSVPVIKSKEPLSGKTECVEENETEYLVAQEEPTYSSKHEQTDQNLFNVALSEVRRNTLQKMMSCDMDCMNEEIQSRGNRLAILINEQQ